MRHIGGAVEDMTCETGGAPALIDLISELVEALIHDAKSVRSKVLIRSYTSAVTERRGRVVNTPASYLESSGFK
jgi:hypothetical protein